MQGLRPGARSEPAFAGSPSRPCAETAETPEGKLGGLLCLEITAFFWGIGATCHLLLRVAKTRERRPIPWGSPLSGREGSGQHVCPPPSLCRRETTDQTGKGTPCQGLPSQMATDWVAGNNASLFSPSRRGGKSEVEVSAGLCSRPAPGGRRHARRSSAHGCVTPSAWRSFLCVSVFPWPCPCLCLLLLKDTVIPDDGPALNDTRTPSAKAPFPSTVTFTGSWGRGAGSFSVSFRGMTFNSRQMCLSSQS